ncbi:RhoGAP-domain-containing protein [Piromyces finnis]|uniref:RhoGAP-domain-containing protein n=1 Tax=Piromyces finnis TaxID=1754191 RepID=A0A1Y1VIY1_9FUNG|nr:RhoGAP-domain-containing protein [Piromyces finnis]|eukprot:ORX57119.1 RhoGAP-domain-containing protein [Piromyces finnis]
MSNEWIELVDPKTSKPFYANIKTGSCTWDKPLGTSFDNLNYNVEWWELYDEKHEMPYYYNTKTKFTEWIRPEGGKIISLIKLQQQKFLKNVKRNSIKYEIKNEDSLEKGEINKTKLEFIENSRNQHLSIIIDNSVLNSIDNVAQTNNNINTPGGHSQILPVSMKFEHYKRLSAEILNHIKNYGFDEYAKKNFMEHRRGLFRKKIPIESLLSWSKQSLRKPLLKSSRNYYKDALRSFSLIQHILSDKTSNGNLVDVQKLVEIGINNAGIRDEIYCQVCKQLNKNPNFSHIVLGWKLMSVLVVAFPPSRDFENYLKSFIEKFIYSSWANNLINDTPGEKVHQDKNASLKNLSIDEKSVTTNDNDEKNQKDGNDNTEAEDERIQIIRILSQHCYRKLARTCIVGPRGKTLSLKEIEQRMNAAFNFSFFGETLEDIMEQQKKDNPELEIPAIMVFLIDSIIQLNGAQTEGIFRVPGDADAISELRCQVEKRNFNLNNCSDPNVPASLLKLWLRELAEPLIPADAYDNCMEIGKKASNENIGTTAWELIDTLPEINKRVISYMIDFLKVIAKQENQEYTKMSVANLAMVFAPNFLRCPSDNPQVIFENTKHEQAFIRILITN